MRRKCLSFVEAALDEVALAVELGIDGSLQPPRVLDVRQAIMGALSILGGAECLCAVASEDPRAFCALLGKLIPVKVAGEEENVLVRRVAVDRPPDETREQWLARTARERGLSPAVVGPATGSKNECDDG